MLSGQHGVEVEAAVRHIAATLGLPDFVFTVPKVSKGGGTREVTDGLLIASGRGALIQVKARVPGSTDGGERWLAKQSRKAMRQDSGSRRSIKQSQLAGKQLQAIPVRVAGQSADIQAQAAVALDARIDDWPSIFVVDHPSIVGLAPPDDASFWVTLQDWRQLNQAIRSVTHVLNYVERVLAAGVVVSLGNELERFTEFAAADTATAADGADTARPPLTFSALEDPTGAQLYRELIDRVWPPDRALPAVSMADYREIVEFLDSAPTGTIVEIGRWILSKRDALDEQGAWAGGTIILDYARALIFACDNAAPYDTLDHFDADLAALAAVRGSEVQQQLGYFVPVLAVGHLLDDEQIDYRYILLREPLAIPVELTNQVLDRFGPLPTLPPKPIATG